MRIIILGLALCSAMSIEAHFSVDEEFDPPVTNSLHNNTLGVHFTNTFSGRVYHDLEEDPIPHFGAFIADNFGDEVLHFQYTPEGFEEQYNFNHATFSGTSINFNNHQVSLSHSSGSLSLSGAAPYGGESVHADHATLYTSSIEATEVDLSYASFTDSMITNTGFVLFKDTVVTGSSLYMQVASGSVQGIPAALPPGMQIISGYFIGEDVQNVGVDFSYNDLRGVSFNQSSDFQHADFTGCIFGHIHGGDFAHADFTGATFVGHIDPSVVLAEANFTAAVLTNLVGTNGIAYSGADYVRVGNQIESAQCTQTYMQLKYAPLVEPFEVFDYIGAASNISLSHSNLANEFIDLKVQVDDAVQESISISNTLNLLEQDAQALATEITVLSNKVAATIHDLDPDIQIVENTNGFISIQMSVLESGDLNSWQSAYEKEITLAPSNDVRFYRLMLDPTKGN